MPLRPRRKEILKDGRQGVLELILEPIFEADVQPGSCGYQSGQRMTRPIALREGSLSRRRAWWTLIFAPALMP